MKRMRFLLGLLLVGGAVGAYYNSETVSATWQSVTDYWSSTQSVVSYRTAFPEYGNIIPAVQATGAIEPVTTVTVGTQVSGQVVELLADYNTEVKKGDVMAVFDRRNYETDVRQAESALEYAKANLSIQTAALERTQAELVKVQTEIEASRAQTELARVSVDEARRILDRKKILVSGGSGSATDREQAQFSYEKSVANLKAVESQEAGQLASLHAMQAQVKYTRGQIDATQATIKQQEAVLEKAKTELERTLIRAPIDGTVVDKEVEVGQTFSASLESPTLFMVAQDLQQMQIKVSVDESDVGAIEEGQKVLFTVDAFPDQTFSGVVKQVRLNPVVVQYVVTYTVIVSAPNPDLLLRPGMTANTRIVLDQRENVLRVPNAALRFRPPGQKVQGPHVWTREGDGFRAIPVRVGVSDGTYSEVSGDITETTEIIVGQFNTVRKADDRKSFGSGL